MDACEVGGTDCKTSWTEMRESWDGEYAFRRTTQDALSRSTRSSQESGCEDTPYKPLCPGPRFGRLVFPIVLRRNQPTGRPRRDQRQHLGGAAELLLSRRLSDHLHRLVTGYRIDSKDRVGLCKLLPATHLPKSYY